MDAPLTKRLVILAHSIKRQHWCLAGKEVFPTAGGWTPGLWVRPIDPAYAGAITAATMLLPGNRMPRLLDIVDVPLLRYANDPGHPEDWLADTTRPWALHGQLPMEQADRLLDQPPQLWGVRTDSRKLPAGFVHRMLRPASLYFLKPGGEPRAEIFRQEQKIKKRLHVRHDGIAHEFDITDPLFESRYLAGRRILGAEPLAIELPGDGRLRLCLSLTPEFHGFHYKIAAAVWEMPPT